MQIEVEILPSLENISCVINFETCLNEAIYMPIISTKGFVHGNIFDFVKDFDC
jgi:hypothetical protein